MTAEVGSGQSDDDINAVADPAWMRSVQSETGAAPYLDDDGAVVIRVIAGNGPVLEGAPPDRTIKLPNLGAHQAYVAIALGPSTLQRVIIDAHEQLEEISLDGTGRIDDLTVFASRDDQHVFINGASEVRELSFEGGSFAIGSELSRPTIVVELRNAGIYTGGSEEGAAQLRLSGHVQVRGTWRVRSALVTPGAIIDLPPVAICGSASSIRSRRKTTHRLR